MVKQFDIKPFRIRFAALKQEYDNSWKSVHMDISKFIRPTRGFFNGETPNRGTKIDHKTLIDSTPARAVREAGAGIKAGLASQSRPWFKLGLNTSDEAANEKEVKMYIEEVQKRMVSVMHKSNFYDVVHSVFEELVTFGVGVYAILPSFDKVIRCENFTAGEYYLGIGEDGRVNSYARHIWMTVSDIVGTFGIENVSDAVENLYRQNQIDEWREVRHLIEPNDDRIPGVKDAQNMPFRSVYWEEGADNNKALRIGGYVLFPIVAPRWELTRTRDAYGKGPGWDALGDSKTLQEMNKDELLGIAKSINPPLHVPGQLRNDPINALPGGLSYGADGEQNRITPLYQINPDIRAAEIGIERKTMAIQKTFYVDLFKMLSNFSERQMTAREVVERHEEKLSQLGPVLERIETEMLDASIELIFHYMDDAGTLPEPPEELQGMNIDIEYISILAQAQRMVGITSIEQVAGFAGNLAAVNKDVLDKINMDKAIDEYAEMLGVTNKVIRSDEEVAEIRQARAEAIQQQMQMEQMQQLAQGAKVMSEANTGGNNALTSLLGGG